MGNPIQGTNVFGPVVPFNTDDIYASHKALYGQGGWRTVKNLTDRNAILLDRREDLMIVAVEDNSFNSSTSGVAFYLLDVNHNASTSTSLLDNNNWVLLNFGYGGDGWIFPPPPQSVYQGKKGQRSFDETYLYICVEDNLWKRVAIDWFIDNGTSGFSNGTSGLNFGDVPIWGTDGQWTYDLVVKNVESIDSTAGNLLVTFTNNIQKIIEVGGDRWILPPPMSSVWPGEAGDRSYDDNYFYVCVQDNLWKRSAYDFFIFGGSTSGGGGSFFSLPNGYVPIWNSTLGNWEFNKVVSNVYYNGTNNELNIVFTNNYSTSFIIDIYDLLSSLDDVDINNATSGDILTYNGSKWINDIFPGVKWTLPAPLTSVSTGNAGDLSYDDNFVYVCINTNEWKRINIDYFVFSGSTSGGFSLPSGSVPIWNGASYDTFFAVSKIEPTIQSGMYGELITYTSGTTGFIPFGTTGILSDVDLGDLADVNVNVSSSSGINNYLIWNGSNWINSPLVVPNATTSGNGLSSVGYNVELGGILTKNTLIEGTNFNIVFNVNDFIVNAGTNSIIFKILDLQKLKINLDGVGLNTQNNINNFAYFKNDLLTSSKTYQLIDKSGTIALNEDLINATSGLWNAINNINNENTTAGNGLSLFSNKVELGGDLYKHTTINGFGNNDLVLNNTRQFNVLSQDQIYLETADSSGFTDNTISINNSSVEMTYYNNLFNNYSQVRASDSYANMFWDDGSSSRGEVRTSSDAVGISTGYYYYYANLKTTNLQTTNRNFEFPDKSGTIALNEDLINATSGLWNAISNITTENTTAGNGLSIIGNEIQLGGLLKQNTKIQGANKLSIVSTNIFNNNTSGLYLDWSTLNEQFGLIRNSGFDNKPYGLLSKGSHTAFGIFQPGTELSNFNDTKLRTGIYFNINSSMNFIKINDLIAYDISTGRINDYEGKTSGDFHSRFLHDYNGYVSIDWGNRRLSSTTGSVIADWKTNAIRGYWTPANNADLITKGYLDTQLNNITSENTTAGNGLSIANDNKTIKLGGILNTALTTINLNNNSLRITDGVNTKVDFADGLLYGASSIESVDYVNRTLKNSTGAIALNWNSSANGLGIINVGSSFNAYLKNTNLTANRTFQFPNKNGIIATLDDVLYSAGTNFLPLTGGTMLGAIKVSPATPIRNVNDAGQYILIGQSGFDIHANSELFLTSEQTVYVEGKGSVSNQVASGSIIAQMVTGYDNLGSGNVGNYSLVFDQDTFNYTAVSQGTNSMFISSVNYNTLQGKAINLFRDQIVIQGNSDSDLIIISDTSIKNYVTINDINNNVSIDSNNRFLSNSSGNSTLNWQNSILYDSVTSNFSLHWQNRTMFDTTNILSIDWQNRNLVDVAGNANIYWGYANTGLKYYADYSANYDNRSLPDKEYVDGKISQIYTQLITQTRVGDGVNAQSEVSLLSSSSGNLGSTTFNANTLKVGDIIKLKVRGYMNISVTGTFTFNIKLGSTTLASRASVVISHPKTNQLFDLDFEMIVRSIGSSGKILGNGAMIISVGNVASPVTAEFVMTNAATIDTTSNQTLDFTVSWTAGFSGDLNTTTSYIKKEKS